MNRESKDRAAIERIVAYVVVVVATLYTIWIGRPDAAFNPGAPPRSDLGGHLVAIKHLVDASIPSGHLLDWSHQWFGGYPTFYFYFPLPALIIIALVPVVPLNVAGKIIAVVAPAWLPPSTFVFVRALGYNRLYAACAAVASVAFLSLTSQYIFGGNVLSSVIGEYSFAFGFAFALLYLSRVARAQRGDEQTIALAFLLAATALSHSIPTLFAVIASCVALPDRHARRQVLLSWIIGFGVSAFWAVPFLVRSRFMGHISWLYDVDPIALFPLPILIIVPWTIAALLVLRPHVRNLALLVAWSVAALVLYLLPHGLFAQGRSLPFWHFALYLWTALGIAVGLEKGWRAQSRLQITAWGAGLFMLVGVSAIQVDIVRNRSMELLSSAAPDREAYEALRHRIAQLPPGRVHWEFRLTEEQLLGGRVPLARYPAEIPTRTSQGLLVESGLTAPSYMYLFANVSWDTLGARYWEPIAQNDRNDERMRARLRQLGIDYFVTFSERARQWASNAPDSFEQLAADSAWTIWSVRDSHLVEPLDMQPRVAAEASWKTELVKWLETVTDTTPWTVIGDRKAIDLGRAGSASGVGVTSSLGHRTVRFTTNAIGVPHIVRVSYFPNWRAYGAAGPYLAVPGFMLVVPTQRDVVLRFERTWVEWAGAAISIITLIGIIAVAIRRRRSQPQPSRGGRSASPAEGRAPDTPV